MDLFDALRCVFDGQAIKGEDWDRAEYVKIHEGTLCVFKKDDGLFHPWTITASDRYIAWETRADA